MSTQEQAEAALKYLAETDLSHAKAKGRMKSLEHHLKTVRSIAFLDAEGTVAAKEAQAYASPEYQQAVKDYEEAVVAYEMLAGERDRAVLRVDLYRTESANRRSGNV